MSNLKVIKQEPIPEIIELFKEMMKRAKTGEIRGVALVASIEGGIAEAITEGHATLELVGKLEALKLSLLLDSKAAGND